MSDLYADQRGPRDERPKLTLHHIIIVSFALIFGGSKAWLSYQGQSTAPTTLDWLYGVFFFLLFYWMGIYEKHADHGKPWLFEYSYIGWFWNLVDYIQERKQREQPSRRGSLNTRID